jgi:copper(I)-binding protein
MKIANSGDADKLVKAMSDVAGTVELHTVEMENNVMKMRPVEFIEIPAKGSAELKPGGFHVMLIGLKKELKPGETFNLTLMFEKAGEQQVQAMVRGQ